MCACMHVCVCVFVCVCAYQHEKQVQEWTKSCEAHQRRASEKLDEREKQVYVRVFTYLYAREGRHKWSSHACIQAGVFVRVHVHI